MVRDIPVRETSVSLPDRWGDTPLVVWHSRAEIELLRETARLPFKIIGRLSEFSGWEEAQKFPIYQWKVKNAKRSIEIDKSFPVDKEYTILARKYREWLKGLSRFSFIINNFRTVQGSSSIWHDQQFIYQQKILEAEKVVNGNFDNLIFLSFEADEREISIEDLAEQILLWKDIEFSRLAKTEMLRIRWLKKYQDLLSETDPNIESFLKEVEKEIYDHQQNIRRT
jgi:hypothetical protein